MSRNLRWYVSVMALPLALGLAWGVSDGGVVDKATAFSTLDARLGLERAASVAWRTERVDESYIYSRGHDGRMDVYAREAMANPARAFPEVEGDGANAITTCTRDTVFVHEVTSTSNSGTGTLDSALNQLHPDTLDVIVFSAAGKGFLGNKQVTDDCWIMAGQTAPGDGFAIRNTRSGRSLNIGAGGRAENWIVRGLTFHPLGGSNSGSTPDVSISDATDWVWAENEHWWCHEKCISSNTASNGDTLSDGTFWRVLQAESSEHEPTAHQLTDCDSGTGCDADSTFVGRISILNSLYHSNSHRNPALGFDDTDLSEVMARISGVLWYNNANLSNVEFDAGWVDVLDSRVKTGPYSNDEIGTSDYSWAVGISVNFNKFGDGSQTRLYIDRVIGRHNTDTATATLDLIWDDADTGGDGTVDSLTAEVSCRAKHCRDPEGGGNPRDSADVAIISDTAASDPVVPITRLDPQTLVDALAGTSSDSGDVGRYYRIACDGTKTMQSDSVHATLLEHVRDSTGRANSAAIDSAYVDAHADYTLDTGTSCTDSDGNALPDSWENTHWGSTGQDVDEDPDGDGWTNVEEYANGSDPLVAEDAINLIPIIHHHRRPGSGPNSGRVH